MSSEAGYEFVNQVLAASNELLRESHRLFRPLGVSEVQFNVLNVLADNQAGLSQRELSDILVVDRSNITTLLDRMEAAGWVKRANHPTDRRIYCVTLSGAGRKLHAKAKPFYLAAIEKVVAGLSEAQLKQATLTLQKLQQGVRQWADDAAELRSPK